MEQEVQVYERAVITEGTVTTTLVRQLRRVVPEPPGPILDEAESEAIQAAADYITVHYAGADRTPERPLGRSGWDVMVRTGPYKGQTWEIDIEGKEVTTPEEVYLDGRRRRDALIEEVQRRAGRRGGTFIF